MPHQMLNQALKMYNVPVDITIMLKKFFLGSTRSSTSTNMTRWIDPQMGVAIGYEILPVVFVMTMQAILDD